MGNYMNSLTQPYINGNNGITNGNNGITNGINGNTRQNQGGPNQGAPINDDDSGQGSSLDRDYAIYNNTTPEHHRYANPPTMYPMDHTVVNGNGKNGVSPAVRRQQQQQQQYSN